MEISEIKPGTEIIMQPYIDSKIWKKGTVTKIDQNWIYIDWEDIGENQHFHSETRDFYLLSAWEKKFKVSVHEITKSNEP